MTKTPLPPELAPPFEICSVSAAPELFEEAAWVPAPPPLLLPLPPLRNSRYRLPVLNTSPPPPPSALPAAAEEEVKSSAKPAEAKKAGACLAATQASTPEVEEGEGEEEKEKEKEEGEGEGKPTPSSPPAPPPAPAAVVTIPVTGLAKAGSVAAPRPRTGGPTCVMVHSVTAEDRSKTEEGDEEEEDLEVEVEETLIGLHSLNSPPAGHLTRTSLSATLLPGLPESPSRYVSSCSRLFLASAEAEGASMAPKSETSIEGGGVAEIIFS